MCPTDTKLKERRNEMKDKSTYKIVIHNPNRVDMNNDILDDNLDDNSSIQEIVINFTNASGEQKKLIIKYINE